MYTYIVQDCGLCTFWILFFSTQQSFLTSSFPLCAGAATSCLRWTGRAHGGWPTRHWCAFWRSSAAESPWPSSRGPAAWCSVTQQRPVLTDECWRQSFRLSWAPRACWAAEASCSAVAVRMDTFSLLMDSRELAGSFFFLLLLFLFFGQGRAPDCEVTSVPSERTETGGCWTWAASDGVWR